MIERAHWSAAALGAIATCCLLGAGCAGVRHARTAEPVPTSVPAETIVVAEPPAMAAPVAAIPQPPVTALQGLPCGQVVSATQQGADDYVASCQDGNRYRVFVNAEGRVVVEKLD